MGATTPIATGHREPVSFGAMRLGTSMQVGIRGDPQAAAARVRDFESAGLDVVWLGEGYGFDVPTSMGYLAAMTERVEIGAGILNVFSRSPAALAQTAAGADWLSGGRAILGLGSSGPQVMEGFHGVPFDRPVQRTREIIDVCRAIWRRERVEYHGEVIELPLTSGPRSTGLGKPIKLVDHPVREQIPIWWASLGPHAVEATAEVADGWIPLHVIPEKLGSVWGEPLERGLAKRDPALGQLEIAAGGPVAIGDDVDVETLYEEMRPHLALYVGGMGARGKNFYNDLAVAYGYEREAALVQDLYLDGKRDEAAAEIPREWLELKSLVGPEGHVRERLAAFSEAGVTVLNVDPIGPDPVGTIGRLRDLIESI
jgi:F420-dependent oxidoreductase-like protein